MNGKKQKVRAKHSLEFLIYYRFAKDGNKQQASSPKNHSGMPKS